MVESSKVIWLEGMFLQPQHLQQQDRYFEHLINHQLTVFGPYNWGITELHINEQQLGIGKFSLDSCKGRLPDGTVFNIPTQNEAPLPLELNEGITDCLVYLAVPLQRTGLPEVSDQDEAAFRRYDIKTQEIYDSNLGFEQTTQIQVGKLNLTLLTNNDELGGYSYIAIAKIKEVRNDKFIILDREFIPPCINIYAVPKLANYIQEIYTALYNRAEGLSQRLADLHTGRVSEINDFLLLSTINRFLPLYDYLTAKTFLHPESFYQQLLQLIGELSTFTSARLASKLPFYQHEQLEKVFSQMLQVLRTLLSQVLERNAIALPLEKRKYSIWVSSINDRELTNNATFVLAVNADLPAEKLRSNLPAQIKIAPIESLEIFISRSLPGIGLKALPAVPRQIPFNTGFTYFELDNTSPYWKDLQSSTAFSFQISENFPGLELEFWAIRG